MLWLRRRASAARDREVAIREIFKDVLANLTYAVGCYEMSGASLHEALGERASTIRDFRRVIDRGCGAYRDIFLTAEWRHDRNAACQAVGEALRAAGIDTPESLRAALVEVVMQSMPGGSRWPGYTGAEWGV